MKGGRKNTNGVVGGSSSEEMNGDAVDPAAAAEEEKEEEERELENEFEQEEEEGFEEQFGDLEAAAEERPKLAEGFYEIEAVRRRRVRKGQVQYLIKWRGWPESANTWEPYENLLSCSDVVDAFEERSSGKHRSSRKRKRKTVGPTPQAKKKPHSFATSGKVKFIEEPFFIPSPPHESPQSNGETSEQRNENGSVVIPPQEVVKGKEQNQEDVNFSESNGAVVTNEENLDIQENGQSRVDGEEPVQAGRRVPARRRKPASVKRFKQDETVCVTNYAVEDVTTKTTRSGLQRHQSVVYKNGSDKINNTLYITKIIRPIGFASNDGQDISVTFTALRSDGKEVTVDNKYLKAKDPLPLINFYERHLKYNAEGWTNMGGKM